MTGTGRRRAAAMAGVAVAVILAVVAVLLALDVGGWRGTVRDGDLRQAAGNPDPGAWDRDDYVTGEAAARLLGIRDDLAFRRAVARFSLTRPGVGGLSPADVHRTRDRALEDLTAVAADRDHLSRAAQAANLAGILSAESPASGTSDISPAEAALESFRSAIALDPDSEHAKRNLERLLRTLRSEQRTEGPTRQQGRFGRSPGGGGLSPPGEGY
ncbi:MAG: hypothetical protein GEU93_20525 [Propionibacteriales bacterium]|nr:hypothetical protein [Propionibacteriales bacterium]